MTDYGSRGRIATHIILITLMRRRYELIIKGSFNSHDVPML